MNLKMPKKKSTTDRVFVEPRKLRSKHTKSVKTAVDTRTPDLEHKMAVVADLPPCIQGIYQSVDAQGNDHGKIVVEAIDSRERKFFTSLDLVNLVQSRNDDLARLAVMANLHEYMSAKRLRELGAVLIQSVGKPMYLVQRDGMHSIEVGGRKYHFYVHRGVIFPLGEKPPIKLGTMLDSETLPLASCDLNEWNMHIGQHLRCNPYLLTTVLAAISSALVRSFSMPRLLLALVGQSSIGKTTAQQIAQSLCQQAKDIENCSGTANGVRNYLEQFADRPAFLDELHMAEDTDGLVKLLFLVGNGGSRKTSTAQQKINQTEPLTCVLITASEKTLNEIVAAKRITLTEGVSARYIEMVIDGEMGVFHQVPDGMTPKQFSDQLKSACETYHGAFWDAWIGAVSKDFEKIQKWSVRQLPKIEARLCKGMVITDRVTFRMVRGLAVWACAGLIASRLKLLELEPDEVIGAVRLVLREHLAHQKHNTTPIGEKVISHVRGLIDRNTARFPALSMFGRDEQNGIYGYTRGTGDERLYLFLPDVFEELIGTPFGTQMAVQKLRDAGYLSVGSEGAQRQFRLPGNGDGKGQRKRFYAVKTSIRFDSEKTPE